MFLYPLNQPFCRVCYAQVEITFAPRFGIEAAVTWPQLKHGSGYVFFWLNILYFDLQYLQWNIMEHHHL